MKFGRAKDITQRKLKSELLEQRVLLHAGTLLSEVLSAPVEPSTAELATVPDAVAADFQFLEIVNSSDSENIPLLGSKITGDVEFDFPDEQLAAGEVGVVVANSAAFQARYGDSISILGEWTGNLDPDAVDITIIDETEKPLFVFRQNESERWNNLTKGLGTSYQLRNVLSATQAELHDPSNWIMSSNMGGNPGNINSNSNVLVIHEVLANATVDLVNAIELFNPTLEAIDISGWWLSDDANSLQKYHFPAETNVPANGFLVIEESAFNPNPESPAANEFGLDGIHGGNLWLTQIEEGQPVEFVEAIRYFSQPENTSAARITGTYAFELQAASTLGAANANAITSPVLISEVLYAPGLPSLESLNIDPTIRSEDLSFVEIYNPSDQQIDISGVRFDGDIEFEIAPETSLARNELAVIVSFDPASPEMENRAAAFREAFGIDESVRLIGGFEGNLDSAYGDLQLLFPDESPEGEPEFTPYFTNEIVFYNPLAPWPVVAGQSLNRTSETATPNAPESWTDGQPSPGASNLVPPPPAPPIVTEVMLSPRAPSGAELAELPNVTSNDFRYLEIYNTNDRTVDLADYSLDGDIQFDFPDEELAPGEFAVVVANENAFRSRYANEIRVLGNWSPESTISSQPTIRLLDGELVDKEFQLVNSARWPVESVSAGASLELKTLDRENDFNTLTTWQRSATYWGTPGNSNSIFESSIVINEIYSHSMPLEADAIELHNVTDAAIDVSGWYISDSRENPLKYRIPDATVIQPNAYIAIFETAYDPNPAERGPNDFVLDDYQTGDIWLSTAQDDSPHTLIDRLEFRTNPMGYSTSRIPNATGYSTANTASTIGSENAQPEFGPVVVSEVHYNSSAPSDNALAIDPAISTSNLQFVELLNASGEAIELSEWQIKGDLQAEFSDFQLDANSLLVLVTFDPVLEENANKVAAFRTHYGLGDAIPLIGVEGELPRDYGRLELYRAGAPLPDDPEFRPLFLSDQVNYDAFAPWPSGSDTSLARTAGDAYGNLPTSWVTSAPSPARSDLAPNSLLPPLITEVMYAPRSLSAEELDALPDAVTSSFAFVEIHNPNADFALDLSEFKLGGDLAFEFGEQTLPPSGYGVVVADTSAFPLRNASEILVLGEWSGDMPAQNVGLSILDTNENTLSSITIAVNERWDMRANGFGSSLELLDINSDFSIPTSWQASIRRDGTPGFALITSSDQVLVNEVSANPFSEQQEFIELFNASESQVDVSGWFVSNDANTLEKFQFAEGTVIGPQFHFVARRNRFQPYSRGSRIAPLYLRWNSRW